MESDVPSNDYGDLESGWKSRLKIPVPQSHGPDVDPDEEQAEQVKPEARKEQPAAEAATLPRDITPEEIAAIHAAAAAFGTQVAEPAAEPEAVSVSDPVAATEVAKTEVAADTGDEVAAMFASAASTEEIQAARGDRAQERTTGRRGSTGGSRAEPKSRPRSSTRGAGAGEVAAPLLS
jgi:hypothetical protein